MEHGKFLTFLPIIVRINLTAAITKAASLQQVKVKIFSIALLAQKLILQDSELLFSKEKRWRHKKTPRSIL
jgi:hypothetical protein